MNPRSSKPVVVTPSVSPQPPRFSSRLSDHPSPSKKQRKTFHESSSSRTETPDLDVQKEREASRLRLLDVWASLAERYSRHMDDDDLVDIRTGKIVKDNGVWRNAPKLRFGTLAAPVDETNDADDEDDEYGFDELDAFAETTVDTDEEAKSDDTGGIIVPPVTLLEHTYADDLREFLEAEKIRKEKCGTDVDEDSEEQQSISEDSEDNVVDVDDEVVLVAEGRRYDKIRELEFPPRNDQDSEDGLKCIERHRACSEPIVVTSDDELDFWRADNSKAVQVVHEDDIVTFPDKRTEASPQRPGKHRQPPLKRKHDSPPPPTPPPHFSYPYATPNHQNHVPNMFAPIPDPRAQLIIAQAVQQLSALVTGPWQAPAPHYREESSLRTPQRRNISIQPSGGLHTPSTHPHRYPYLFDPAFSGASLPPESPELHHTTSSRRSLVSRSHSCVRKVSFQLNGEESDGEEVYSDAYQTPTSNRRSRNALPEGRRRVERPSFLTP